MKQHLLQISLNPEHSFSARHDVVPIFYNKWHYHKELELVCIVRGSGNLLIGHEIKRFKRGDLILIGSNLPHMWGSDKKKNLKKNDCQAFVTHFLPDCLGKAFFEIPENKKIAHLISKAEKGIEIVGNVKEEIICLMKNLLEAKSTERVILLLQILQLTSSSKANKLICRETMTLNVTTEDSNRISKVYQYVMNNYYRQLTLKEVASVINLSPNSFCRYFKSRTRKSFSTFLIEVRISQACKLLVETQKTVSEICYECGYNSFSNFNKHFLRVTTKSPLAHRKCYTQNDEYDL